MDITRADFLQKLDSDPGVKFGAGLEIAIKRRDVRLTVVTALEASRGPDEIIRYGVETERSERSGAGAIDFVVVLRRQLLKVQVKYGVDPHTSMPIDVSVIERFIPLGPSLVGRLELSAEGVGRGALERVRPDLHLGSEAVLSVTGKEEAVKPIAGLMAAIASVL
jgi:hypothetical protein